MPITGREILGKTIEQEAVDRLRYPFNNTIDRMLTPPGLKVGIVAHVTFYYSPIVFYAHNLHIGRRFV